MKKIHLASYHKDTPAMCLIKGISLIVTDKEKFNLRMHNVNEAKLLCKKCKEIYRKIYK